MNARYAPSLAAETMPPRHQRAWRLLSYRSLLLLLLVLVGLAMTLSASAPAKMPAKGTPMEAAIAGREAGSSALSPAPLLTLKAEDIPLLKSLRERQAQLDEREKQLLHREEQLASREADLLLVQQHIEEKLTTLSTLRAEITALLQEKAAFEEKRFEHLVKMYEVMKPEEASSLFERLNEETAARLLYQMKEKKAGQILASISPQVAARLSERLAAQRTQEAQQAPAKEKP